MDWYLLLLWGALGGLAVEAVEFRRAIRRTGDWPWKDPKEPRFGPFLVSVFVRVGLGSGLAIASGLTNQVSGAFGALAVGVAAPLMVEQLQGPSAAVVPAAPGAPAEVDPLQ